MRTPPRSASLARVRRAGWNVADQALSALTNTVMAFVVARNVSAEGFGAFSVAFLIFSLVIGVERSLVGQPLAMHHSHETPAEQRLTTRLSLGTALALGLAGSLVALVMGLALPGVLGRTLLALACVLPFLIVQDTARMAFFAWGRPRDAAINDAVWAVVQFGLLAVVVAGGMATPPSMVLCWGVGAAVAVALALVQLHGWPALRGAGRWARQHRAVAGFLMLEYLVGIGAFQGGILLIGAALGVGDIGSLRAAQVLMGPIGILSTAAMTFGVPEIAKRRALPARTERLATVSSAGLFVVTGSYVALLLLIPDSLGEALLGDTWTGASSVLLPVALASVVAGLKLGPSIIVYGLGLARRTIWLEVTLGTCAVLFMGTGAYLDQARGLAWGLFAAQAVLIPWWFVLLHQVVRSGITPAGAAAPAADGGAASAAPVRDEGVGTGARGEP